MGWRTLWTALKRLCGYAEATAVPEPRTKTYASETGLVEITTPVSSEEPPSPEEQAHHQFIASNWTKLAAAAYAGFQRHGIGVVVIEKRTGGPARPVLEDAFETHDLAYATGMGMWTQRPPHSTAPGWLDEQFQTYEPLEAGLFLFRPAGDGIDEAPSATPPRPYHAAGTPPPPEALKQSRAPFN
jgi:hypothetical protein